MRQGEGSGAAKPDRPQVSIPNCRISSSLFKIQNSLPLAKKGLAVQETASPPVLQKAVFGALTDLLRENTTLARLLATKWHFTGTDFFVALACALFSYAAVQGILLLCPMGCGINTDLQNYAQVLEVSRNPAPFARQIPWSTIFPTIRVFPICSPSWQAFSLKTPRPYPLSLPEDLPSSHSFFAGTFVAKSFSGRLLLP